MSRDETTTESNSTGLFKQEGYELMSAAFEVHQTIGGGLLEEIYQEALAHEFGLRDIPFLPKPQIEVQYKDMILNKRYIPDFTVHSGIVVELKAVSAITPEHEAQLLNYMRICRMSVGYLINFAPITKVEWKRFVLSQFQ